MILENEFTILLDQFKYLDSASSLLGTDYLDNKEMLIYGEITPYYDFKTNQQNAGGNYAELEKAITNINKSFSIANDPDITSVLSEIEKNLYCLHQNKESQILYSKNMLRKFLRILPYVDLTDNLEYNAKQARLTEGQLENAKKSINLLCYGSHGRALNFLEQYIVNMMVLLWAFSDGLHSVLLKFAISLVDLQNDLGIHLMRRISHQYLEGENFTDAEIKNIAGPELTSKDVALSLINFFDQNTEGLNVNNKQATDKVNLIILDGIEEIMETGVSVALNKVEELRGNSSLLKTKASNICIQTLKSLFKDQAKFDSLMDFMKSESLVLKAEDILVWKGYKANRKYEVLAFYEALYLNGFLKTTKRLNQNSINGILKNSFTGFSISDKTASKKDSLKLVDDYKELLVRFNGNKKKHSEPS